MIASNTVDDGSEPNCANARSVLHLLNELSDNNPNEERHWYLKKMLDKSWKQYYEQKDENEQLRKENDMFSCELSVSANKEISRNCRIAELEEENEQLKQFKEKVFTLIDNKIGRNEEAIEWGKETGADSGSIGFYNDILYRLKKELSE